MFVVLRLCNRGFRKVNLTLIGLCDAYPALLKLRDGHACRDASTCREI